MATGAPAVQTDPKIDLFKLRAAEYRERYESMRNLEWKVLFQTYAGYAGIAAGVAHIHGLQWDVPRRMMIGTFYLLSCNTIPVDPHSGTSYQLRCHIRKLDRTDISFGGR